MIFKLSRFSHMKLVFHKELTYNPFHAFRHFTFQVKCNVSHVFSCGRDWKGTDVVLTVCVWLVWGELMSRSWTAALWHTDWDQRHLAEQQPGGAGMCSDTLCHHSQPHLHKTGLYYMTSACLQIIFPMFFLLILPPAFHPKNQPFAKLWSLHTHTNNVAERLTHIRITLKCQTKQKNSATDNWFIMSSVNNRKQSFNWGEAYFGMRLRLVKWDIEEWYHCPSSAQV